MKKCAKSQPEPECLSSIRKTNPNATWKEFQEQNRTDYTTIRNITRQDQGNICAYCEINLEIHDEQIAHFHPKFDSSPKCNWAFEWNNLWLACKGGSQAWMQRDSERYLEPLPKNLSCDQYKGDKILDGLVFAPGEIPAFPRIFRFERYTDPDRMEIFTDEVACAQAGISVERVQRTIQEYNLNCTRIAVARWTLYHHLEQAIERLRESDIDKKKGLESLVNTYLAKDASNNWQKFFTLVRWRLGVFAEKYLESIIYDG